jgi:NAD(P)H-hydrate repair Nnr-like enzyme with NAD(P)H-hydrate dehydratase domain
LIEDDIEMNWECRNTVREARAGESHLKKSRVVGNSKDCVVLMWGREDVVAEGSWRRKAL